MTNNTDTTSMREFMEWTLSLSPRAQVTFLAGNPFLDFPDGGMVDLRSEWEGWQAARVKPNELLRKALTFIQTLDEEHWWVDTSVDDEIRSYLAGQDA